MGDGVDTHIHTRETSERVYRIGGEAYRGKENKSGHANKNQNPLENACME
jgi:hypothetical protein